MDLETAVTEFFTRPDPLPTDAQLEVGSVWWEERDGWRCPWRVTSTTPPMGYPCGEPVKVSEG